MTVLPREVRRSGRRSRQAGGRDGGLQEHLIGPVPPPLCRWMADRLPAHDPLLPPHGPLREDKIPSERRRQRRAARGQIPTALGAAPGPTDPAGPGRICPLRTDHLGEVEANGCNLGHGRSPPTIVVLTLGTLMPKLGTVHPIALGIVDPATGELRQVPLGEGSAPHGVIPGPDGAAWITDGGQNAIVRYDPRTGELKRWPLPAETGFANLNTATFGRKGVLWFTGQSGIYGSL